MRDLIIQIFGEYQPVAEKAGLDAAGNLCYGIGTIDFAWIAGVLLFTLVLYCTFRILGGLFKRC